MSELRQPLRKDPMRQIPSRIRREIKAWLLKKYGPYCQICIANGLSKKEAEIDMEIGRAPKKWSVDHIIPYSKGGSNRRENMQPAHQQCNHAKGDTVDETKLVMYSSSSTNY
jgi:5-methylcytosine-specific restriction endonuclease McrA